MKDSTRSKLIIRAVIGIMILCGIYMLFSICEDTKAEEIEKLIIEYPVWAVSTSGDSTFQTVRILKCYETYPNGQRELLGYVVTINSFHFFEAGHLPTGMGVLIYNRPVITDSVFLTVWHRIYEEDPEYFLTLATVRALSLRDSLAKK